MKNWLNSYLFLDIPEDSRSYRQVVTSNFILLCTLGVLLFFTASNYIYGNTPLYYSTLGMLIAYASALVFLQKKKQLLIHCILFSVGVGILAVIFFNRGQQYVPNWSLIYCYILMVMYGHKKGGVIAITYLGVVLSMMLTWVGDTLDTLAFIRFTSVACIMLFLCYITELLIEKTLRRLSKTQSKLERLSTTDGLTMLYNRRYFDKIFKQELMSSTRSEQRLALAMLDIDYFKLYNDTYGHHAGDLALIKIAHLFKAKMQRANDYAFRIGGEEFAVLFYARNDDEAITFIEAIQSSVEALNIEHSESPISSYLTVSAGVYLLPPNNDMTEKDIYKQCDALLYQAKEKGRNRVVY